MEPGTETGTEERYVRCRRCHGVFEAGLPNCTRCGAAYTAPTAEETGSPSSYVEKFQGTEFAEPEVTVSARPPTPRSNMTVVLGVGAALVLIAVLLGSMALMGAFDGDKGTAISQVVIAATPTPTPGPTLPPVVTETLAQLSDPMLNLHASIRTTLSINARVDGNSHTQIANAEVDCAGGDESGVSQSGTSREWRLVSGVYYVRTLPSGKWKIQAGFTPFIILSPLFMLTEPQQLQYIGPEDKNGVKTQRLETTAWWSPDVGKLSGLDVTTLRLSPQHTKLVLWVASDGAPVSATFRAWAEAKDGTGTILVDIQTNYTFTNQGAVQPIPSPSMK